MKRKLLGLSVVATLLLASCGNSQATIKEEPKKEEMAQETSGELIVSTFGLSQDIVESDIIKPFEEANGVKVVLEVGNASERLTKVSSGGSNVDVIELSQAKSTEGISADLFEVVTENEVPNIKELSEGALEVLNNGGGIPFSINSIGIAYNKEKLGKEITTWEDLWSADLAGKVAIPDITTTAGPLFLHVASDYAKADLSKDMGEGAFKALEELKPNIVKTYTKSSDLANMFQAGEIEVAVLADFAVSIVKKADENITFVVPESGTYANYNTVNIVKDAKNKDAAYKFVNHRISKENQAAKAKSLNEAPVNSLVELDEASVANMTYGDVAKRAKTIDFKLVNENMKTWIDQWNKLLNQ